MLISAINARTHLEEVENVRVALGEFSLSPERGVLGPYADCLLKDHYDDAWSDDQPREVFSITSENTARQSRVRSTIERIILQKVFFI